MLSLRQLVVDAAATIGSLRTLGTGALQACAGNDSRLSDSRTPSGSATGFLGGTYPSPTVNRGMLGQNEFYWPPPVPAGSVLDLDANAQWWRKVGSPTGGVIYTTATAESVATTYGDELLKCVAASASDGLQQLAWTYANEKRVKSGRYLTALVAVYIVTAARTLTVSLVSSVPTTIATASTSTVGSWVILALEPGSTALDGTTVTLKATLDGAGTFYLIPLGAEISATASPSARALPRRQRITVYRDPTQVKDLSGLGNENTWTDVDVTSATSALATMAKLIGFLNEPASNAWTLGTRRNGSSYARATEGGFVAGNTAGVYLNHQDVLLDDAQIFEYLLFRYAGASTLSATSGIQAYGWEEWA